MSAADPTSRRALVAGALVVGGLCAWAAAAAPRDLRVEVDPLEVATFGLPDEGALQALRTRVGGVAALETDLRIASGPVALPRKGAPVAGVVAAALAALALGCLRRDRARTAAFAGFAIVAGWLGADAALRRAEVAVVTAGGTSPTSPPVRLLSVAPEPRAMLVVRFREPRDSRGQPVAVAVPAEVGRGLDLWPGPGSTRVEVAALDRGARALTRERGDGPPAVRIRWPAARAGRYDTWLLRGNDALIDPDGRFRARFSGAGGPPTGDTTSRWDAPGPPPAEILDGGGRALSGQAWEGAGAILLFAASERVPVSFAVAGVPLEVAEWLPDGSAPVEVVRADPRGAPAVLLRIAAPEGTREELVLVDDLRSALFSDGARLSVETRPGGGGNALVSAGEREVRATAGVPARVGGARILAPIVEADRAALLVVRRLPAWPGLLGILTALSGAVLAWRRA